MTDDKFTLKTGEKQQEFETFADAITTIQEKLENWVHHRPSVICEILQNGKAVTKFRFMFSTCVKMEFLNPDPPKQQKQVNS